MKKNVRVPAVRLVEVDGNYDALERHVLRDHVRHISCQRAWHNATLSRSAGMNISPNVKTSL